MKTLTNDKKGATTGKKILHDPEFIYDYALALWYINPDLAFEKLLVCNLVP